MFQKYDNFNGMMPVPEIQKCDVVVIDQFDSQDFNLNESGWIRNSISELQRCTSKSQYDAIMAKLVEIKSDGGIPEGMSVQDAISQIKPRWAQSPNEIEQFIAMTNGDVMTKLNEAYEKSVKKSVVDSRSEAPVSEPSAE